MRISLQKMYLDLNLSYVNISLELQVQRGSSEQLNYKLYKECRNAL